MGYLLRLQLSLQSQAEQVTSKHSCEPYLLHIFTPLYKSPIPHPPSLSPSPLQVQQVPY
jgi:hypothetical protein